MAKKNFLIVFLTILLPIFSVSVFDLAKTNKHGATSLTAKCNKDTVIDFAFSSSSQLTFIPQNSPTIPDDICGIVKNHLFRVILL